MKAIYLRKVKQFFKNSTLNLKLLNPTTPKDISRVAIAANRGVRRNTVNAFSKGSSAQICVNVRDAKTVAAKTIIRKTNPKT